MQAEGFSGLMVDAVLACRSVRAGRGASRPKTFLRRVGQIHQERQTERPKEKEKNVCTYICACTLVPLSMSRHIPR